MNVNFTVKGAEELVRTLRNTQFVLKELTDATQKSRVVVHQRASSYPPQRPGSTYRRTRRLGNSWAMNTEPFATGVETFVSNPTEYGPYVMAPENEDPHQAWMHVGVWPTTRKILEEKRRQIVGFFTVARDRIVETLKR
jgi:hypothetical protein